MKKQKNFHLSLFLPHDLLVFHPKERGSEGLWTSFLGLKVFFPMVPPIKFPMVLSMVFPICSSWICSLILSHMLCKKFLMLFPLFSYVSPPPPPPTLVFLNLIPTFCKMCPMVFPQFPCVLYTCSLGPLRWGSKV